MVCMELNLVRSFISCLFIRIVGLKFAGFQKTGVFILFFVYLGLFVGRVDHFCGFQRKVFSSVLVLFVLAVNTR